VTSAELLRKAAEALENGRIPLMNPWLVENDVTLDQCMALADQLAIGARMVAEGIEHPRSPQGVAMLMTMATGLGAL
jgi:hypothetical protein